MGFFGKVAKFFGVIKVRTQGNQVKITGIDGLVMRKYIQKMWQTDIINKMMFSSITDTSLTFHEFFIPDVVYMLTKLRDDPTCGWSGKTSIDKIMEGILTETWFKRTIEDIVPMVDHKRLKLLKWKPLPHQLGFLDAFGDKMPRYDLRGMLLAMAPGTGKTFTDLMIAACVVPPSVAEVKIIISPKKALHLVWEKSIRQVFHKVPTYWCCDSGTPMPTTGTEYYIFNFEALDKALELAVALKTRNVRYFVIVDESHNFADPRSTRTQKLVKLQTMRDDIYFVWTSGSPILKKSTELISFLKGADPRFDADAERRFKRIFDAAPGRANEIFNHRLGQMMAYIVGKNVVSDTKPTVKELPVKLPPSVANKFLMSTVRDEMKAYIVERLKFYEGEMASLRKVVNTGFEYHAKTLTTRAARREFDNYLKAVKVLSRNPDLRMADLQDLTRTYERAKLVPSLAPTDRKHFRAALSAIKNIKLKVRGEALGTILSGRRSECAAALAYYCKPEEIMKESLSKTLFFASSVLPIQILGKHLHSKGFNPALVYAGTNSQLVSIMEQFEEDPNLNPVCATMQSLSEAVPVIAASTVVLLNRPFRQATWDQVVARADRMGQKHPVTVIEVTLDTGDQPNVSSTTDAILANVRELINEIVGPEFAGPDPEEREFQAAIDASQEEPELMLLDEKMGL